MAKKSVKVAKTIQNSSTRKTTNNITPMTADTSKVRQSSNNKSMVSDVSKVAKSSGMAYSPLVKEFLKDLGIISALPISKKHDVLLLSEYPFDDKLLHLSPMYRESRRLYLSLGGKLTPKVCSTRRSLSDQDIFKDEIDFTPSASEVLWFKDHAHLVADPEAEVKALTRFSEISLFHEQNHRIIWRLLPPAPQEQRDLCRYLNFAESLVVTLDLALGDELGPKLSPAFERMKAIYRPGGEDKWSKEPKETYRRYLLSVLCATYYALELIEHEDILKAIDYLFPNQKKMNKDAVTRALELSELFTQNTNPQWQSLYWQEAQGKLEEMHIESEEDPLYLPEDPLDLEAEFFYAHRVFDYFGL